MKLPNVLISHGWQEGKMHGMLITICKVTEIDIVSSFRKNENLNEGNPNHSNLKKDIFAACSKTQSQR